MIPSFRMTVFPAAPETVSPTLPPDDARIFKSPSISDTALAVWAAGSGTITVTVWLHDQAIPANISLSSVTVEAGKLAVCPDVIPRGSQVFFQITARSASITAFAGQFVVSKETAETTAQMTEVIDLLELIEENLPALFHGRLPVDTNDAYEMVPQTGNGTAQPHPTVTQLNSANSNVSNIGWYITNEHETRALRIGDSTIDNTTGFLVGPKQSWYISSSKLVGHFVVAPDGPVPFSVWGES